MSNFTFVQKVRNKIRVDKSTKLKLATNIKLVGCRITIKGLNNKLELEEGVKIHRSNIEIMGNNCSVKIGKNSMIGDDCYLMVKEEKINLMIGESCGLSRNVKMMASDGHPIYQNGVRINEAQDIILGDNIWIADNVTILKGVEIASGAVVGINSMVTKSIPSHTIVAGNPARVVKEGINWEP
ncbi:MAG: Transferase hexapeptide repeat containing protein [uncultured Sulfurovum sp.]|uniref:Transferase hexapeptide repeat containing protein n=1 Tax=uncultured Sulfurovum sp. TaxID=269237 RepID=A0A6S6SZC6_9BACT|nr:MAG: Transferase hexapeptide repeat containing protein [uncultured Sulfurovum sp.]